MERKKLPVGEIAPDRRLQWTESLDADRVTAYVEDVPGEPGGGPDHAWPLGPESLYIGVRRSRDEEQRSLRAKKLNRRHIHARPKDLVLDLDTNLLADVEKSLIVTQGIEDSSSPKSGIARHNIHLPSLGWAGWGDRDM